MPNAVNDRDRAKALGIAYADALVPNLLVAGFVGRLIQNKELQLAVAGLGLVAWDCKSFNQVACGNFLFAFGDTVDAVLDAAGKTARVLGTTRCDGFGNCFFESSPPYSDRRPT